MFYDKCFKYDGFIINMVIVSKVDTDVLNGINHQKPLLFKYHWDSIVVIVNIFN